MKTTHDKDKWLDVGRLVNAQGGGCFLRVWQPLARLQRG
jgi:hypothetical protein